MTSGSILPLDITVNVTSSLESTAFVTAQTPYDISVTVTTSSLITIPFINVGATSSLGSTVVVSALEPYNIDVSVAESGSTTVVSSDVLPFSVTVSPTASYTLVTVPSSQGNPQFNVITTAETNASTASVAYQAYTASHLLGFIESASYAATASVLYGSIESASFSTFAVTSSYAITASYAANVPSLSWTNITNIPTGLVSASVQVNTGSFSGSITVAQTASFVATASYANTSSYSLTNKDIVLPICNNQPATTTVKRISNQLDEPDPLDETKFDLSTYSQYRVISHVTQVGPSGSKLGVQYSTDQTNWNYLDILSGSLLDITVIGVRTTNWFYLDVNARTDVFIRWVTAAGDNLSDTSFRYISLGVR